MEFAKHKVYKHKNNVDVAFLVTDVNEGSHDGGADELYLRGIWLRHTGLGNAMHQIAVDTITVKVNDMDNWVLINQQEGSNE